MRALPETQNSLCIEPLFRTCTCTCMSVTQRLQRVSPFITFCRSRKRTAAPAQFQARRICRCSNHNVRFHSCAKTQPGRQGVRNTVAVDPPTFQAVWLWETFLPRVRGSFTTASDRAKIPRSGRRSHCTLHVARAWETGESC